MGWLDSLRGSIVAVDSAPFIYLIEEHPSFLPIVEQFFAAVESGSIHYVTSSITITEVLVHPYRQNRHDLVARYRSILSTSSDVAVYPVVSDIADSAARLRAAHNLRTPDAIQLATALMAKATAFLTNDYRLSKLPEINVVTMADAAAP
ncbi:MAG: PIN domain-containing protein [Pirellulales bacterium]|nr:PIN domain-containing protein [Pirellulales bacterium]